jgi:hypothetical protein
LHFGQPTPDLSAEAVVDDFKRLAAIGAKSIFVVSDNFVNHPSSARSICEALRVAKLGINWKCYAALPGLSDELVALMHEGGCNSIFIGLDAINSEQFRYYGKHFFRSFEDVIDRIARWAKLGIRITTAFVIDIVGCDITTLHQVLYAAARLRNVGAGIRFNCLCSYNGTPIDLMRQAASDVYSEARLHILTDSHPIVIHNSLARKCTDLFPFHRTDIDDIEWKKRLIMLHAAQVMIRSFPKTCIERGKKGINLWRTVHEAVLEMDIENWIKNVESRKTLVRQKLREYLTLKNDVIRKVG